MRKIFKDEAHRQLTNKQFSAFTLTELIIVIFVFSIAVGGVALMFSNFVSNTHLNSAIDEMIQVLRTAQTNSITRYNNSSWGVNFDQTANQYTLFSGASYATRDTQYDRVINLVNSISISQISFESGITEAVFNKVTGETSEYGTIQIQNSNGDRYIININQLGRIDANKL